MFSGMLLIPVPGGIGGEIPVRIRAVAASRVGGTVGGASAAASRLGEVVRGAGDAASGLVEAVRGAGTASGVGEVVRGAGTAASAGGESSSTRASNTRASFVETPFFVCLLRSTRCFIMILHLSAAACEVTATFLVSSPNML